MSGVRRAYLSPNSFFTTRRSTGAGTNHNLPCRCNLWLMAKKTKKTGLNAPGQHLLPVEVWTFDVVMDLMPCPLDELVALRSGDPPRLSRKSETSGIGLPRQDHSLKMFDSLHCLCCGGSRHNQSIRESRWHSKLSGQRKDRAIWRTIWSTPI